ncbi:MAG TPA: hypothetical protein PLU24_01105, partial [Candidatus Omnitrophota bacterium]|nr:hypothetical protein [Candidatus Omnitrophota bacterium]
MPQTLNPELIKNRLLDHSFFSSKFFKAVSGQAKKEKKEVYLVGGFLRDMALGRVKEPIDLDFSMESGSIEFGRKVARALGAGFVVLDREHGCSRVVISRQGRNYATFDFVDFRGHGVKEDLLKRDFTVNALAIKIPFEKNDCLDFCGACSDLEKKVIRMTGELSFDEDPLRILRAFSLSAVLGFKIDPKTMRVIEKKRDGLKNVAGERMRDELFKIFGTDDSK